MKNLNKDLQFQKLLPSFYFQAIEIVKPQISAQLNWDEEKLKAELEQQECFGAFFEGKLISFLILAKRSSNVFEIPLLATDLKYQGQGVMEDLLVWLFASFPKGSEFWIEVHEANAKARNLYKKLGFQVVGQRPQYYSDGACAILLTKYF